MAYSEHFCMYLFQQGLSSLWMVGRMIMQKLLLPSSDTSWRLGLLSKEAQGWKPGCWLSRQFWTVYSWSEGSFSWRAWLSYSWNLITMRAVCACCGWCHTGAWVGTKLSLRFYLKITKWTVIKSFLTVPYNFVLYHLSAQQRLGDQS